MKKFFYSFVILLVTVFIFSPRVIGADAPKEGLTNGFYKNNEAQCLHYPWIPHTEIILGFCVEQGVDYTSGDPYKSQGNDEINGVCGEKIASLGLGCKQYAAAYYGAYVDKTKFWGAQSYLNGRTYYSNSQCTTTYDSDKSVVEQWANNYCSRRPDFGSLLLNVKVGETKTFTDVNGVLGDFNITNPNQTNYTIVKNGNKISVTGLKETSANSPIVLYKGTRNSSTIYCSETSQTYIVANAAPYLAYDLLIHVTAADVVPTYGSFVLHKKDEFGDNLTGVKFKIGTNLNGSNGTDWAYYTTDANGKITKNNILVGSTYYYQEVEAPEGYNFDDQIYEIKILNTTTITKDIYNYKTPKGIIQIVKGDALTGTQLGGAKYKVGTNLDGIEGTDWDYYITSNNSSIVINGLDLGADESGVTYYVQEVEAPEGYILDEQIYEVTLSGTKLLGRFEFTNTMADIDTARSLQIFKIDAITGDPLKGVKINVYKKDGTLYYEGTTNEDGLINLNTIVDGEYYLQEVKAPAGYEKITTKYEFEISETTPEIYITLENQIKNVKTGQINIVIPFVVITILGIGVYLVLKTKQKLI